MSDPIYRKDANAQHSEPASLPELLTLFGLKDLETGGWVSFRGDDGKAFAPCWNSRDKADHYLYYVARPIAQELVTVAPFDTGEYIKALVNLHHFEEENRRMSTFPFGNMDSFHIAVEKLLTEGKAQAEGKAQVEDEVISAPPKIKRGVWGGPFAFVAGAIIASECAPRATWQGVVCGLAIVVMLRGLSRMSEPGEEEKSWSVFPPTGKQKDRS